MVVDRDWNRIEAELGATLLRNRDRVLSQPTYPRRKPPELAKNDSESILEHIKDALEKDADYVGDKPA